MKLRTLYNTVLKGQPVQSHQLSSRDKIPVYAESEYKITTYKSVGYGHLEIYFVPPCPGRREIWYVFAPHVQILGDEIARSPSPKLSSSSGVLTWKWPMRGTSMGSRTEFGYARGRLHAGVDIGGYTPDECYAASEGVVEYVKHHTGGADGRAIHIRRSDGWEHRYLHLRSIRVNLHDRVSQGQLIAIRGGSGFGSEGREIDGGGYSIHLHFEIRKPDGTPVDPRLFLPDDGSVPIVG
ncbi:M23 family metallopeptidase [Lyngbya sp. CCY1209]|uniref:M23 family metallopeptidase n=1 Tax=Lyngbya sp. CCY1209 TaxID=2886103 RepID=UPI002D20AC27|nr:M23 family metallopeptidase [Lyngbya sp. CCY1209]MEB3885807.1 M23 family metallopeptidase [Lyngbya sp. CCY1209]